MLNQAWHTTSTEYPITFHSGYMRHRRKKTHAHACAPTHKRVKHHHLETIYWTFATRYQLNTELSILCLHPNSRDRLHFITLRGGNVTGLGKAHIVLEVILAFGLRIICEKMSLPLKMSDGARPPRREPRRENQYRGVRGDTLLNTSRDV